MGVSKRGKAITLHTYDLRLTVASEHELSDKRLSALASRLQMLLNNMNYVLLVDDGDAPLHVEGHRIEVLDGG